MNKKSFIHMLCDSDAKLKYYKEKFEELWKAEYLKEHPAIHLPENVARRTFANKHSYGLNLSYLTSEKYWKDELRKCMESEEYFYNNYLLVKGSKPEIVPEGYFDRLRKIKGRRKGRSGIIPRINPRDKVLELVKKKHVKLIFQQDEKQSVDNSNK